MKPGLPTSFGLHATLLAVALFSWGRSHDEAVNVTDAIEVEIGDTTLLKLGSKTGQKKDEITPKDAQASPKDRDGKRAGASKQEEPPPPPPKHQEPPKAEPKPEPPKPPEPKPEPPKPVAKVEPPKPVETPKASEKATEVAKEPPPPKPPEKKEPPKDEAKLEKLLAETKPEPKKPDPKPAPPQVAKADPVKAPTQPAKPAVTGDANSKSTSAFNSKEISDILNKSATGTAQAKSQQTASLGSPNGVNAKVKMTQTEIDAFVGQVRKCWNPPPGASDVKILATLRVVLAQDGSVEARPTVIEASAHPMGNSFANSAIRAIMQCGPYRLPPEKFATWHDFDAVFTPNML